MYHRLPGTDHGCHLRAGRDTIGGPGWLHHRERQGRAGRRHLLSWRWPLDYHAHHLQLRFPSLRSHLEPRGRPGRRDLLRPGDAANTGLPLSRQPSRGTRRRAGGRRLHCAGCRRGNSTLSIREQSYAGRKFSQQFRRWRLRQYFEIHRPGSRTECPAQLCLLQQLCRR